MARYLDEDQAAVDGITIVHEPERHRFAVLQRSKAAETGEASDAGETTEATEATETAEATVRLIGEAHYSLRGGDTGGAPGDTGVIDFDHTVVSPAFRGTGLSGLLAHHALTSDVIGERRVQASCWFIEGYLAKHPEILNEPRS